MLKCTHPSKDSCPFFHNVISFFWKFATPLISSESILPNVYNFFGLSHLSLRYSGVIRKKVRIMARVRGMRPEDVITVKIIFLPFSCFIPLGKTTS